jgi:integrase
MSGKQAKILLDDQLESLLIYARNSRWPVRNEVLVLFSVRAGLRAGEISKVTWEMVLAADGSVGALIELHDRAAKKQGGRRIPLHRDLRNALVDLQGRSGTRGPIVGSERGGAMSPIGIVQWFARAYRSLGLIGCSSHSGRRTFITRAARVVHEAGGSLRDVQLLAGHRSIVTTQRYIDGDTDAQRRLVMML